KTKLLCMAGFPIQSHPRSSASAEGSGMDSSPPPRTKEGRVPGVMRAGFSRTADRVPPSGVGAQYESALTTSPWEIEPRLHNVVQLTLDWIKRTEPSAMSTLAPPGWKLVRPQMPPESKSELVSQNWQ